MKEPGPTPKSKAAWQIETLVESARRLAELGQIGEAEAVYLQVIATAPYNIAALNFLATQAMRRGEHAESVAYLECALRAAPDRSIIHQNLAMAHKAAGDLESALAGFDRATELDPNLRTAYLQKGGLLEEMGKKEEAIGAYWRAWRQFPIPALLEHPSIAPPHLRLLCVHAARLLQAEQLSLFEEALQPLRKKHGNAAIDRIQSAAEIYAGTRAAQHAHPLQKPCFIFLPGIDPRPFFDRSEFPWLEQIESATDAIRAELDALLEEDGASLRPYIHEAEKIMPPEWRELNGSKRWSSFHLHKSGLPNQENCSRCPATTKALSALPLPVIDSHAPEAFFSILQPGTHIPPHHGLGNYKLVVHLPLLIPGNCMIRVGDKTRVWRMGECLVFDDSFAHEAWNHSDSLRAVLIFDIWNPLISQAEREGMVALAGAISTFKNRYCEPP